MTVEKAEIRRATFKPTTDLDAYDHVLRGIALLHQGRRENIEEALQFFAEAARLDPSYAAAYAHACRCHTMKKANTWAGDRCTEISGWRILPVRHTNSGGTTLLPFAGPGGRPLTSWRTLKPEPRLSTMRSHSTRISRIRVARQCLDKDMGWRTRRGIASSRTRVAPEPPRPLNSCDPVCGRSCTLSC